MPRLAPSVASPSSPTPGWPAGAPPTSTDAASLHLAITVVRQDDTACLISPLVVERDYGLITLVWMGAPASQYGDVLLDHGRTSATEIAIAFRHGLDHVAPDVRRLGRVRADAAAAPLLRSEKATVTDTNFAPFIELSTTSTDAASADRFSATARKNRRPRRRFEEKGPVTVAINPPGAAAAEAMATALAFKQDWLVRRGEVCSALHDRRTRAFLERVVTTRDYGFNSYISVMSCNGEPVSVQFGITTANRLALHLIAYKPAWETSGAGILHTEDR
jgi:CelD/BcsL family acetyltransferase involved in cellulose biosynthesis